MEAPPARPRVALPSLDGAGSSASSDTVLDSGIIIWKALMEAARQTSSEELHRTLTGSIERQQEAGNAMEGPPLDQLDMIREINAVLERNNGNPIEGFSSAQRDWLRENVPLVARRELHQAALGLIDGSKFRGTWTSWVRVYEKVRSRTPQVAQNVQASPRERAGVPDAGAREQPGPGVQPRDVPDSKRDFLRLIFDVQVAENDDASRGEKRRTVDAQGEARAQREEPTTRRKVKVASVHHEKRWNATLETLMRWHKRRRRFPRSSSCSARDRRLYNWLKQCGNRAASQWTQEREDKLNLAFGVGWQKECFPDSLYYM
jgi:hypothetical protein